MLIEFMHAIDTQPRAQGTQWTAGGQRSTTMCVSPGETLFRFSPVCKVIKRMSNDLATQLSGHSDSGIEFSI